MKRPAWQSWVPAAVLLAAAGAAADTRITSEEVIRISIPGNEQDTKSVHTLWLDADRAVRLDAQGRPSIINRLDRGEAYLINHADRSYAVIELGGGDEVAAAVEEFEPAGEIRQIDDWTAQRYDSVWVDPAGAENQITVWMSDDVDLDLRAYRRYMATVADLQGIGFLAAMTRLDGYPVLQEVDTPIATATTRLVAIEEAPAPAGVYEVPDGYARR